MTVLVLYALFIVCAFESLPPGVLAMPCAETKVINKAGDRPLQPANMPGVTPEPVSPVRSPATPVSTGQTRRPLTDLRKQGIRPAILLAGDLLLLIVALIIVVSDKHKRPR